MRSVLPFLLALVLGCGDASPAANTGNSAPPANTGAAGNVAVEPPVPPPEPPPQQVATAHREGDRWVYHFEIPGVVDRLQKVSILTLDGTRARLVEVRETPGLPVTSETLRVDLKDNQLWAPDPETLTRTGSESVRVGAQSLACETWHHPGLDVRYWYCRELPLFPLVRMEAAGSAGTLIEFTPGP